MLSPTERFRLNDLSEKIIGAAIEVHREIGPGLLESAYEECLCFEIRQRGVSLERQVPLPVCYKGIRLDCGYRLDILAEDSVVIELKTVGSIQPVHEAQLLSYLRLSDRRLGLILNFHVPFMKRGIKRIVHNF